MTYEASEHWDATKVPEQMIEVAGQGDVYLDMANVPEAVILEHAERIRQGQYRRGMPWVLVPDVRCERVLVNPEEGSRFSQELDVSALSDLELIEIFEAVVVRCGIEELMAEHLSECGYLVIEPMEHTAAARNLMCPPVGNA